jgi:hypothetical protein
VNHQVRDLVQVGLFEGVASDQPAAAPTLLLEGAL